jgi:hypothetical protein
MWCWPRFTGALTEGLTGSSSSSDSGSGVGFGFAFGLLPDAVGGGGGGRRFAGALAAEDVIAIR